MNLKKIKVLVEESLRDDESTRDSDWKLYNKVCEKLGISTDRVSVKDMCTKTKDFGFPSFESVTRFRRKIQESGKYLASKSVQKGRLYQQELFYEEMA